MAYMAPFSHTLFSCGNFLYCFNAYMRRICTDEIFWKYDGRKEAKLFLCLEVLEAKEAPCALLLSCVLACPWQGQTRRWHMFIGKFHWNIFPLKSQWSLPSEVRANMIDWRVVLLHIITYMFTSKMEMEVDGRKRFVCLAHMACVII